MKQPFQPEIFGKYYLVDRIAVGGMAEIFKAKTFAQAGFEKLLVIKRILTRHTVKEEFVTMFIDEAKITAKLQHPNIVHTYDFGILQGNAYIAMECIEGKDTKQLLSKLSRRRKHLPEEFGVFIAHQMLTGLEYAHEKIDSEGVPVKVIHRDVSPANILVSYEGEVKVADFGIAKARSQAVDTKDGVLKGKFEYMSPLQAQGKQVDHRTDIFSTGIVLWEMLTGRRLFKTDSDVATLEKIKAGNYPPPSALNPRICDELDAIVSRALTVKEEDRYQSAREFADALEGYLYPSTPSSIQRSLKSFMGRVFSTEISSEREALTAGSIVAAELHAQPETLSLLDDWDDDLTLSKPKRSLTIWAVLIGIIAIGGITFWATRAPEAPPVAPVPDVARVTLHLEPENAVAAEGGTVLGVGPEIRIEDMTTGSHMVTVEAEGFISETEQVFVVAGEHLVQRIRLRPLVVEEPVDELDTAQSGDDQQPE